MHVQVSGPVSFDLVAIWSQGLGYVENVHAAREEGWQDCGVGR